MTAAALAAHTVTVKYLDHDAYLTALADAIRAASRSIRIAAYLVTPPTDNTTPTYSDLWSAIADAQHHCPDIRLLLNAAFPHPAQAHYNDAAAVRFTLHGWRVRRTPTNRIAHSKLSVIDGALVFLGSSNLSPAKLRPTDNRNLLAASSSLADTVAADFDSAWARATP